MTPLRRAVRSAPGGGGGRPWMGVPVRGTLAVLAVLALALAPRPLAAQQAGSPAGAAETIASSGAMRPAPPIVGLSSDPEPCAPAVAGGEDRPRAGGGLYTPTGPGGFRGPQRPGHPGAATGNGRGP